MTYRPDWPHPEKLQRMLRATRRTMLARVKTLLQALVLIPQGGAVAFFGGPVAPYPKGIYDAATARAYFNRRPVEAASRALEIGWRGASFAGALLGDSIAGDGLNGPRAAERADALTNLLVDLGPTFIKLGQSASVRTDLLSPTYSKALSSLQENVPAFSSAEAREIITAELGQPAARSLIDGLSSEPIAAASLGQVYRGTLDGAPVAVKVQRPSIENRIALDMYLVREFGAPLATAVSDVLGTGLASDLAGIADAWGTGLVEELDYRAEAANAANFNEQVAEIGLEGSVFAPSVVESASTKRVLTMEWVDGERLDETDAVDDVPRIASLAMNTYMNMMLETGCLQCDPHPGNLLRTKDGQLCILDWGLVSRLDKDLRLTLIEHVAHVVGRDYDKLADDLVRLGFVPKGQEQAAQSSGAIDLLTYAYSKRAEGGGFANFDVPALLDDLTELSAKTGSSIFQIPPYFAYIIKAFATLEGIGISQDPMYSILNETLPYISRRMLNDRDPRTVGALKSFVFGEEMDDRLSRVFDADRVGTLIDGARRYAAAAALTADDDAALLPANATARAEVAADALLDLLSEDTPAAKLVTEQLVLVLGASSRQLFSDLRQSSGTVLQDRSLLGTLVDPLGLFRNSALIQNGERDVAALEAAEKLVALANEILLTDADDGSDTVDEQELVRALAAKAFERRQDLQEVTRRVLVETLNQAADRLAGQTPGGV